MGKTSILGTCSPTTGATEPKLSSFGDYELLEEAGRGAMGVVYRARQRELNRIIAIKMCLTCPFAADTERLRFQAEAEAAAQLDHPNIVPIYDFGEHEGRQFYVMRWLEGGSLSLDVSQEHAARLIATVSRAVHHAHQRGVLHRDIKPGNILLDDKGQPFVADFGLARRVEAEASQTASGSPLGTPAFMSPEQAMGEKSITTATDVWGLGAVLYSLIAGHAPFQGKDAFEVMAKVREGLVVPPQRWNKSVNADLATICLRCLRKEPSARYASANDLADDLERWLRHEPIHARPIALIERFRLLARRRPAITALSLLAIALSLAGLTGVFSQWRQAERARDGAQSRLLQLHAEKAQRAVEAGDPMSTLPWMASALAMEKPSSPRAESYRHFLANTLRECLLPQEIWFFDHGVGAIAFSPDGRHLAAAGEGRVMLADLDADGRVLGSKRFRAGGKHIIFSLDGKRLFNAQDYSIIDGVLNDGFVKVFELPGLRPLPDIPVRRRIKAMDLSRDGKWLATGSEDGTVEIHDTTTGELICPPLQCGGEVWRAEFNPVSTRLSTSARGDNLMIWEIPSGREVARIRSEAFRGAHFSPDGQRLLVTSGRAGRAQVHNPETLAVIGPAFQHHGHLSEAIFSPDGKWIATAGLDHTARIWNAETGEAASPPLVHANAVHCLDFSPDGTMLATGGVDPAARIWSVPDGKPLTPWLRHGGRIHSLKFSPSSRHLLTGSADGQLRLWPVAAYLPLLKGEGGRSNQLTNSVAAGILPAALVRTRWNASLPSPDRARKLIGQPLPAWQTKFSADGKLTFATGKNHGRGWRTTDWTPLTPVLQADGVMDQISFSPDGQRFMAGSRDHQVRVWKFDSAQPVASFTHSNGIAAALWLPDSRRVFSGSGNGDFALWDESNGRLIRSFTTGFSNVFVGAVSPDGKWLAGNLDVRVAAWDADSGKRMWFEKLTGVTISALRFSPDSRLLVTGDQAGAVRVLRAATGNPVVPSMQHAATVRQIRFSPDGHSFATASDDLTARLWSSFTGQPLMRPLKLSTGVREVSFSPNGRWLAVLGYWSFQMWDAHSGVPVSLIQTSDEELGGGAFLDDHRWVCVSEEGTVREYRLETLTWPAEKILPAMELISGMTLDANGDLSPMPPARIESSTAPRQAAEATWLWLHEQLKP
ncbi:MAG: protein kinase [Akkermansiaceae bacterium]|nr:protein kinase [Verrucomicrobiales bacterium]